jgi:SNF2 family DNA or RNA helicase
LTIIDPKNENLWSALYPHQHLSVSWLVKRNYGLLADDMGLGKTLSVLAAFSELKARSEVCRLLVACPNSLVANWLVESKQWLPDLSAFSLPQGKRQRLEALTGLDQFDICIFNYESVRLPYVHDRVKELLKSGSTMMVFDESQRVKNPIGQTFKALKNLAGLATRRYILSGTPTPKDVSDIWAQMYLVDLGERFGSDFFVWLASVAELGNRYSEYAVKRFLPTRVQLVKNRVQQVMLRRTKDQVLELPEKIFVTRRLTLTGDQLQRYERIRKELLIRVSTLSGKAFLLEIRSVLEEYLRAVQIASNPRILDDSWKGEPAKFVELDNLVDEIVREKEEKLVIWTNYLHNVAELVERYADCCARPLTGQVKRAERAESVTQFQDSESECRVLVALPSVAGVGLTLTAARTAVYIDKTWNAEHWMQSVDRIHRIGQTGSVVIISLLASPVDALIEKNIERKIREQANLLDVEETELFAEFSRAEMIEALSS